MAIAQATFVHRLANRIDASRLPAGAPVDAINDALARLGESYASIEGFIHGMTILDHIARRCHYGSSNRDTL